MQNTRSIEVDFDVHKYIEAARTSFSETANETLRRILGIGSRSSKIVDAPRPEGHSWSGKGVELPHGTELKMEYNGRQYFGTIANGSWVVEGKEFSSPSPAASSVGITKRGNTTNLDGWRCWSVKLPGQIRWTLMKTLRKHK